MPANTYGSNLIVFGVPALTGYKVQDYTEASSNNIKATVQDENGRIVWELHDDKKQELNVSAVFDGATLPTVGETVTYNSIEYIVDSVDVKGSNKDTKKVDIKGHVSEYLTLS